MIENPIAWLMKICPVCISPQAVLGHSVHPYVDMLMPWLRQSKMLFPVILNGCAESCFFPFLFSLSVICIKKKKKPVYKVKTQFTHGFVLLKGMTECTSVSEYYYWGHGFQGMAPFLQSEPQHVLLLCSIKILIIESE